MAEYSDWVTDKTFYLQLFTVWWSVKLYEEIHSEIQRYRGDELCNG